MSVLRALLVSLPLAVAACDAVSGANAATFDPLVERDAVLAALDDALLAAAAGDDPSGSWAAAVHRLDMGLRDALVRDCGRRCALELEYGLGEVGRALTGDDDATDQVQRFALDLDLAVERVALAP